MSAQPTPRDPAEAPKDAPKIVLGIDLGTTNSLAAVVGKSGPHVLRDRDGNALIPSVVSWPDGGSEPIVGRTARERALDLPDRTVHSIKRLIGRAGPEVDEEARHLPYPVVRGDRDLARVRIDGRDHSPEEISALILRHVQAQAHAALGQDVRDAVITVPAYFDDAQRQATRQAAELAGLRCLRIVNEPTAASLAYGIDGSRDGTVLVYDLGGGTFDVSILKIQDGVFRVLATAGNTHLGGDDFDRLLAERILAGIPARTDASGLSPFARQAIRKSAEGLKIQLSSHDSASLSIDLGSGEPVELRVNRAELEAMIAPLIEETLQCCRRALRDAEVTTENIDDVVLVGGSTRIPLVRRRLEELVERPPHTDVDPDLAVALGAAIQADILAGKNRSLLLLDVIPLSLGIETMGGVVSKLILRNATIPTSVTEEFSTQVDDQSAVDINIYQGERERIEDCRELGAFKLRGIPPMPAGLPRIAVTFLVDADGVLKVSAKEQRTGVEASIQVVPTFGLTQDEVRRMMQESLEHAVDDMTYREAIELCNKARAMVKGARAALASADLPPDQAWPVKEAVKGVEKALADAEAGADADARADVRADVRADARADAAADADRPPNGDALRQAVEALSRATAQIADDVISSAVKRSFTDPEPRP